MTEHDEDKPIDLGPIDPSDPALADRIVGGAMRRIDALSRPRTVAAWELVLDDLTPLWRPGLAAAATFTLLALGALVTRRQPQPEVAARETVEAQMLGWAETGYVPSNGELLATFQGNRK